MCLPYISITHFLIQVIPQQCGFGGEAASPNFPSHHCKYPREIPYVPAVTYDTPDNDWFLDF